MLQPFLLRRIFEKHWFYTWGPNLSRMMNIHFYCFWGVHSMVSHFGPIAKFEVFSSSGSPLWNMTNVDIDHDLGFPIFKNTSLMVETIMSSDSHGHLCYFLIWAKKSPFSDPPKNWVCFKIGYPKNPWVITVLGDIYHPWYHHDIIQKHHDRYHQCKKKYHSIQKQHFRVLNQL